MASHSSTSAPTSSTTSAACNASHAKGKPLRSYVPEMTRMSSSAPQQQHQLEEGEQDDEQDIRDRVCAKYSQSDIKKARMALAEAGYANSSWHDISRVFEELKHQQQRVAEEAPEYAVTNDEKGHHRPPHPPHVSTAERPSSPGQWHRTDPSSRLTDDHGHGPVDAVSPPLDHRTNGEMLHTLDTSLRLQRYIEQREQEMEELCIRPGQQQHNAGAPLYPDAVNPSGGKTLFLSHTHDGVTARNIKEAQRSRTHHPPPSASPQPQLSQPLLSPVQRWTTAHGRRAANIVYNFTGDQRFRFYPTTSAPRGSGIVGAAASPAVQGTHTTPSSSMLTSTSMTSPNGFNTERLHVGKSAGRTLSTFAAHYLDPAGSTLVKKADPVKRGQQMRLLWERDKFLSQRNRTKEAWRTRQITMAYQSNDGAGQ